MENKGKLILNIIIDYSSVKNLLTKKTSQGLDLRETAVILKQIVHSFIRMTQIQKNENFHPINGIIKEE